MVPGLSVEALGSLGAGTVCIHACDFGCLSLQNLQMDGFLVGLEAIAAPGHGARTFSLP